MKNSRLIAYNILKQNILANSFCTGCGACEAVCPIDALKVKENKVKRLYDCSENLDLCPICNEVCPHSQALLLRSAEAVSDAPVRSEAVGYLRKILLAQANDLSIKEKGADGAVVSALLTFGLNTKTFDSTVVTGTEDNNAIQPKAQVALTPKEAVAEVAVNSSQPPSSTPTEKRSSSTEKKKLP